MKTLVKTLCVALIVPAFMACSPKTESADTAVATTTVDLTEWESFGEEIDPSDVVALDVVIDEFTLETEKEYTISGTLVEVCQSKGCWTVLNTEDGRSVKMTFANYGFFLPTDAAGREIIAEGVGFKKVSSVEEQRHDLEDANASEEAIAAITEEKVEYAFEATGVLLKRVTPEVIEEETQTEE